MGEMFCSQRRSYLLLNGREVLCPEKKLPFIKWERGSMSREEVTFSIFFF
jgi:hypothetical protein